MSKLVALLVAACAVSCALAGTYTAIPEEDYSVLIGVSFSDADNGVFVGGTNNEPLVILTTNDGAQTLNQATPASNAVMLLAAASSSAKSAVASGLGLILGNGVQYTTDGETFEAASIPSLANLSVCTSQSVKAFVGNPKAYGAVGDFGSTSGVAVSQDGGATWNVFNYSGGTEARYGAYPSAQTWFITGGTWPNQRADIDAIPGVRPLSRYVHVTNKGDTVITPPRQHHVRTRLGRARAESDDGFKAVIMKTTNGGKSFSRVFYSEGTMYFNEIACTDANTCWAVAEGDVGAWIYGTTDGGSTWNVQHQEGAGASLMAISFADANNGWAGGLDSTGNGLILSTTDGGKTWTAEQWAGQGYYVTALSFPTASAGFGTLATNFGFCGILTYKA